MKIDDNENNSDFKQEHFDLFFEKIQQHVEDLPPASIKLYKKKLAELNNYPLTKNQAIYILGWQTGEIIFHKGIQRLLGYPSLEIDLKTITDAIHPDDIDTVYRLLKASVEMTIDLPHTKDQHKNLLISLTYRMKKKNGDYIKVLRQSNVFHTSPEGKMLSNFSVLTDISFIDNSNRVDWKFEGHNFDDTKFKQIIYDKYQDFFSPRELSIIELIYQKYTSRQIAERLYISKHTVDTHRKNILHKSNCKNAEELLDFCKKNGIL